MGFVEFEMARQLMAEEKVGRRIRQAEAEEDAEYQASLRAMQSRRG